jgi:hypothetical protein
MKHLVIASLLILGASTSHAVVADHFTCTTKITDYPSATVSSQTQDFSVLRLPSSGGTTKPYDETMGSTRFKMKVDAKHGSLFVNLNMYYKHASRQLPGATGLEARQFMCMGIAAGYCKKHSADSDGVQLCNDDGQVACMEKFNPFDPVDGWKKTAVNGKTPVFDDSEIAPASAEMSDPDTNELLHRIEVNCKFLGTYK